MVLRSVGNIHCADGHILYSLHKTNDMSLVALPRLACHARRTLKSCWLCGSPANQAFQEKACWSLTKKHLKTQVPQHQQAGGWRAGTCSVCVCARVRTGGLTPAWSKRLLNDLVPEGTCTASRGSLSETSDWLDIEVRRWDTKVVPRPAFLIQLGPDKTAAGKTTNQIRWQFSTVSNYCCSKGGPDKINQTLERFSHSWFPPPTPPFFFSFFFLKTEPVLWMRAQGALAEPRIVLGTKREGWFMGWITG